MKISDTNNRKRCTFRRVLQARGPKRSVRFGSFQKLLRPQKVTGEALLRDGLLILQVGGEASAIFKTNHGRRRIQEIFPKSTREGRAVNHFSECVNFAI